MRLAQYYPDDVLGRDPSSQWAPNHVALEGWLRAFCGGAVPRRVELAPAGERACDEAARWDMVSWTVEQSKSLGQ